MSIKRWERENYVVREEDFDGALHMFVVWQYGIPQEIVPNTIEDMESIIKDLDEGADVKGWEDGNGNPVYIHNSMFERLRYFLENETISYEDFTETYEDLPVTYENNGQSGLEIGTTWYTASFEGESFDFRIG